MLEKINSSAELKALSYPELEILCREIREFLIDSISETGGHLASNLGTVELSVALNRVYDAEKDRILFDVGHQCYTHKILNGRRDQFHTLRQFGGISGFPKPYESEADPFIAGHASDSLSVALGMAKARTILHDSYDVCAVIGDGALTGGLAYEGIENIAASMEPIVIILNDNAMSISSNVGGMSSVLSKLRLSEGYYGLKKQWRQLVGIDSTIYRKGHRIKEEIKKKLFAGNLFTSLGLNYLGPIDGHDLRELESAIRLAREMRTPVLLHVITLKGKGCAYAEAHPELYHGIGPFDKLTGRPKSMTTGFGDMMGKALCALATEDERITAITAAMADGTGLFEFSQRFPKRFFDVGIAEGHACSMAAGMAKQGLLPVFAVYSSFLQRSYDMIMHDVSLQKLHVVFCVDRAGIVGNDGETHNGVFDVAYLSTVPGMTILTPASFAELRTLLRRAVYEVEGPVAIRYPRGTEGAYQGDCEEDEALLGTGTDLTIVTYGMLINQVLSALDSLREIGISCDVIKLSRVCPLPHEKILTSLRKTRRLLVVEEVCRAGSIGLQILALCEKESICLSGVRLINLGEGILPHGSVSVLQEICGLNPSSITSAAEELVRGADCDE